MKNIEIKYPNRLKEFRLKLKLTQNDLALMLNLNNSADRISHWENGQMMPSGTNLLKLAKIFEVSAAEIYPEL